MPLSAGWSRPAADSGERPSFSARTPTVRPTPRSAAKLHPSRASSAASCCSTARSSLRCARLAS